MEIFPQSTKCINYYPLITNIGYNEGIYRSQALRYNEIILYKVPWCSTNESILYKVPWCSTNEIILYKVPWCSTNESILYKVPWCSTNEIILCIYRLRLA